MAEQPLPILDVHTPSSSFAIVYSSKAVFNCFESQLDLTTMLDTEDSLETLYEKLTRKLAAEYHGQVVGPGWVKYSWNESTWNLDDGESPTLSVPLHVSLRVAQSHRVGLHNLRLATEVCRTWEQHKTSASRP